MNFLLIQPLDYLFVSGGAHKANRFLMEGLAQRGHKCIVLYPLEENREKNGKEKLLNQLEQRQIQVVDASHPDMVHYHMNGVDVYASGGSLSFFTKLIHRITNEFNIDWTIVTEDRSFLWVEVAHEANPGRAIFLSHSQATLPFGPECFVDDPTKTRTLQQMADLICVSEYLQRYAKEYGNLDSTVLRFPSYGAGPFPFLANFDQGAVTMINPSMLKGSPIFIELAQRMPEVQFAAVPTWSTTGKDRAILEALPNVQFIQPSPDMNDVLKHVKVLLVPSLWGESFGQVVVDAMLRGIPVLASDVGGLPEAKLGVEYLLPVTQIREYSSISAKVYTAIPVVPAQDVTPWETTLRHLLNDREHYNDLAQRSQAAALNFINNIGIEHFERYFLNLQPRQTSVVPSLTPDLKVQRAAQLAAMPAEQRALLAQRLKQRRGEQV